MIYLTFIGNHDRIDPAGESTGAVLTIFRQYREQITQVFMLVTPQKTQASVNYRQIADQIAGIMAAEKPDIQISVVQIPLNNPVDFDLVYPTLLHEIQSILEGRNLFTFPKLINITSGTPTMTTCWVLLQQSGILTNAKLVQSFETRHARERGRSTQEVNLDIDDFPQINAPDALRRQLTVLSRQYKQLSERLHADELDEQVPDLIGKSPAIREVKAQILQDVTSDTHVLIIGERGTGKQIVANEIWQHYHRTGDSQLLTFDCGSLPENLIESELFGHVKGAFTGATEDKLGILQQSQGRMIFLDEIGNLPRNGQQALLRFINNGELRQIGSSSVQKVKAQVIAATNQNIDDPTLFAQDLKDRFDERIFLPPLRERREDIPMLIRHFLQIQRNYVSNTPLILADDLMDQLLRHNWPGNVRELEKFIRRLVRYVPNGGSVGVAELPERYLRDFVNDTEPEDLLPALPLPYSLDEYVEQILEKARNNAGNNMAEVDRLLRQNPGTERQRQYRKRRGKS
ncbi:MAG: sigma 54-interacting transcriptional regulator [Calditrichaeota bacterium]|nr:sigma 54-interacting transcriptional regulator [Calditrichota bacterium]